MMVLGTFAIVFLTLLNANRFFTVVAAQTPSGLVMNTPLSLTLCQNANLSWANAPPGPVYVSVVPGGQPTADALKTFDQVDASQGSVLWLVDQPVGTSLTILIRDSTGEMTGSAAVTVKKGVDDSCLRGSGSDASTKSSQPKTSSSNNKGNSTSDHSSNQSPTSISTQSSVSHSASPSTPTSSESNSTASVTTTNSNNSSTSPLTSTTSSSNPATAGSANGKDIATSTDSTNGPENRPSSSPPNGAERALKPALNELWLATMGAAALAVVLLASSTH